MSIQNVQFLVKAQAGMLFCNIAVTILTGFILLFSGHWHLSNFGNIFASSLEPVNGIPGWIIGMALLITPYFGFETVPQMVEEGDFPIKNSKKAICGSILTCGCIYVFYYFCVAGLDGLQEVHATYAQDAKCSWLDFLAYHCRNPFLSVRYGSFSAWFLDVYSPHAVLYGKQKLPS